MNRVLRPRLVVALVALFLGSALLEEAAGRDGFTPHQVAQLRSVREVALSPDGRHIAFTLSVQRTPGKDEDGPAWSELHVWDRESRSQRPFISGEVSIRGIRWTPDGTGISFLDKREGDDHTCLYVIPLAGGEARRAVAGKSSLSFYDWHADNQRVAYIATEAESKEEKKRKKEGFKAKIYEEAFKNHQVFVATAFEESEEHQRVELKGSAWSLDWRGDSDQLAVSLAPTPLVDDRYMYQKIYTVNSQNGEVLGEFEHQGKLGTMLWNRQGTHLALLGGADMHDPSPGRLFVGKAPGGPMTQLFADLEGDVDHIAWQSDDALLCVGSEGVHTTFRRIRMDGTEVQDLMPVGGPALTSLSVSQNGKYAAFAADAPEHPTEVFAMSQGDAHPARLTESNTWLGKLRLGTQQVVEFTARDGLRLEGLLIHPLDEEPGQRYPLVLIVHGGPESHYNNGWLTRYSTPGQVLSARGYAVFYPNYRGSTGRGLAFAKSSQGDPAGKEFDDLIDAVDHLVQIGLVDRDKVGVTGGSYGGYATAWCATRYSEHFAAGVMFVGISNKISKVGTTDIPDEEFYVHARHRPWEDWQFFLERSPIYYADNCKTSLLILHGEADPRVNVGQSRELYRHVKLRGSAPVRLVLYPGEGHGNRKAAARLDYSLRSLRWMDHFLKGPGGEAPPSDLEHNEAENDEEAASTG